MNGKDIAYSTFKLEQDDKDSKIFTPIGEELVRLDDSKSGRRAAFKSFTK